jgi:hypothetical protein
LTGSSGASAPEQASVAVLRIALDQEGSLVNILSVRRRQRARSRSGF